MVTSASTPTPGAGVQVSLDYDSTAHVPKLLWGWAEARLGLGARKAAHLDLDLGPGLVA